jgi:hypothetical protein
MGSLLVQRKQHYGCARLCRMRNREQKRTGACAVLWLSHVSSSLSATSMAPPPTLNADCVVPRILREAISDSLQHGQCEFNLELSVWLWLDCPHTWMVRNML